MLLSDGVRAPLITDLQNRFKVQCTVDGKKGVLFNQENSPQPYYQNAFGLNSGFVPFRKTKISSFLAQRPAKPWESLIHNRPHSWNGWNISKKTASDARDALYLYTYRKNQSGSEGGTSNSLPVVNQGRPRPNTVSKAELSDIPKQDSNGHRRSYTATQRSRADQVRARKAVLKKFSSRLHNDTGDFFAVRQVLPSRQSAALEKTEQSTSTNQQTVSVTRQNTRPRLPVRIDRPMKKEKGRYRPISRTAVRTPSQVLEISTPRDHKDPQSAEAYKVILHEKRQQSLRHQRKRTAPDSTQLTHFRRNNNTMASHYDDTENKLLQSVIEVNKPPSRADSIRTPPPTAEGRCRDDREGLKQTSVKSET